MKIETKYNVGDVFWFKTHSRELIPVEKTIKNVTWKAVKDVNYIAIENIKIVCIKIYSGGFCAYDCEYINKPSHCSTFSETFINNCKKTFNEAKRMKAT